jgi:LPS-assembly protein
MICRTRFLISAICLHLIFLLPAVVTPPRLLAANEAHSNANSMPALPSSPSAVREEEITIRAIEQEKVGPVFKLRGQVEIRYRSYNFYADEVTYDSQSGDAEAEGHVVLDGGPNDEHIEASHGKYNIRNESGVFYNVVGTTGIKLHGTRSILTSSNPFVFTGKKVEKDGPDHYIVYDGTVTTCELPHPKWQFNAHKIVVDVGGNAKIYHSDFRIKGIPVFYFPFATHPVERLGRQSGFMIPNIGNSSVKGVIAGESMYWAPDRSNDLTLGTEYYSIRGWAPHGEFRSRPNEDSYIDLNYAAMFDRGFGFPPVNQGGQDIRLNSEDSLPHNIRGVAQIDYLTSFVYRLAFNEYFNQAVNSEVKSQAFLSKIADGFSANLMGEHYQNFESTTAGDVISIWHAPSLDASSVDRQVGHSPLYWSFDAAAGGLSRSEPGFTTDSFLARFDLSPTLSLPLLFKGWSLRPALTLRDTLYSKELLPGAAAGIGTALNDWINRKALETSFEIRPPALDRVFDNQFLGRKWKHVIEPMVTYDYVTGVNNFSRILRFDDRDILSNTNEIEYSVTNRLYAKRSTPTPEDCSSQGMPSLTIAEAAPQSTAPWVRPRSVEQQPCPQGSQSREIVSWELKQKYFFDPTFGGALVPGTLNVLTTTADFTGISFLTDERHFSPLASRLRISTSARTDAEWDVDYDFKKGRINGSTTILNYYYGPFTIGGGDAYLLVPNQASLPGSTIESEFHQFRVLLGYGRPNKRGLSGAASFGFDARLGFLQYGTLQTTYNWDCCGLSLEFRRFALGSVRNENLYRFNFTLANIAAFGNLRRQERLF